MGENILRWQISPEICADNYQDIKVTLKTTPAQPDHQVTPEDYFLQSTSHQEDSYNWYLDGVLLRPSRQKYRGNDHRRISGSSVNSNGCTSRAFISIYKVTGCSFLSPARVGAPLSICAKEAQLEATLPAIGTGIWTLIQGTGEIATPTDASSRVTGLSVGRKCIPLANQRRYLYYQLPGFHHHSQAYTSTTRDRKPRHRYFRE